MKVIIILDWFESSSHGQKVSDSFQIYFEKTLKKEMKIKPIYLSFNKELDNIQNIDLITYKERKFDRYIKVNNQTYSFEKYIEKIRILNPNSKILLSLSFHRDFFKNEIIDLSKKYNYKIAQAYFNNGFLQQSYENNDEELGKTYFNVMFWVNFIMDKTNTIIVPIKEYKPLFFVKYIDINDLYINNKKYIVSSLYGSSNITPIIGYEYYLNKNSNLIKKDNDNLFFD